MMSPLPPWPWVAPLAPEESEHYRWLLSGLVRGLRLRAAERGDDVAIRALETIFDLADELVARLETPPLLEMVDGFELDGALDGVQLDGVGGG